MIEIRFSPDALEDLQESKAILPTICKIQKLPKTRSGQLWIGSSG